MPTAFQLRTRNEIIQRMFATVNTQVGFFDRNIGAFIRAILEASSLSDAEQYVMLGKLLSLFDRRKCKSDDLDRRMLEFGADLFPELKRVAAQTSIVSIVVTDGSLHATAILIADIVATSTTFQISDPTNWPTAGSAILERGTLREENIIFKRTANVITVVTPVGGLVNPHIENGAVEVTATQSAIQSAISIGASSCLLTSGTEGAWPASGTIIFERDTIRRESLTFTRIGTTVNLGATTSFAHGALTSVILSTFGSDRPVSAGSACYVPADVASVQVLFRTSTAGKLLDGDLVSSLIQCESDQPGAQTKVGSNTITQWQNEPFANATVTNPNAAVRGSDREDDDTYNKRVTNFIQSLGRGTALAIETFTQGNQDPFSDLTVSFAQTVEPVGPGEALCYVTDGSTTFSIDFQIQKGRDVLISDARTNDRRARLHAYGPFQVQIAPTNQITPRLFISSERGSATLVGTAFLEDNTKAWTVNQWVGYTLKTDDNQFYAVASNTAIRLVLSTTATPSEGSYALINFAANPLVPGTDFNFNPSNGDLELAVSLQQHDALVAADDGALSSVGAYTYSRGLAAYAQRIINGDRTDLADFPGLKSLGTQCRVVAPTIVIPDITIQIVTQGLADADLASTVQSVVQSYVNGLGIGQQVLLSEIIRLVKGITGVADCAIIFPNANITVQDGQLPRVNASNITVV